MTSKTLVIVLCTMGLLTGGCAHVKKSKPVKISTEQHSPVRMHIYDWPEKPEKGEDAVAERILILPPLGIEDAGVQYRFHEQLYSSTQRRFHTPVQIVQADSIYAPYITYKNLIHDDGTVDTGEVALIGSLMNCTHVICPLVREIKPYHPQRIDLRVLIISSGHAKICAEFFSVLDANDRDVVDYFLAYSKTNRSHAEKGDDLFFKIKSPAAFQSFVTDTCISVIAEELSL